MFIAVFLYLSSILFNASLLQNVSSHWLWICILFWWIQIMIVSLVRYLHLMHCPEIAMRESLSLYDELQGKDVCGRNSDLNPWSYFILRRMSYGNHQILCNSISSDSELNINIGKLPRENEERRRHRSKEKRDASHFKLQTDFVCVGGEEGDTGFGAQLLETGSICCHIYQPGWFILKCLPGELGFVCKWRGYCLVAVCGQADGEGCHCMPWGWARIWLASSVLALPDFLLWPT